MRLHVFVSCSFALSMFACGHPTSDSSSKPTRRDAGGVASQPPAQADAAALAATPDAATSTTSAAATPDAAIEASSGDPAAAPKHAAKPPSAADKTLLAFAHTCAEALQKQGNTNIAIDSARITHVSGKTWVVFSEKQSTPAGEYTLDVTSTKKGCVWIPRE